MLTFAEIKFPAGVLTELYNSVEPSFEFCTLILSINRRDHSPCSRSHQLLYCCTWKFPLSRVECSPNSVNNI